jgi:hypothetical protein
MEATAPQIAILVIGDTKVRVKRLIMIQSSLAISFSDVL